MDLIYTNAAKVDKGVLSAYAFDLSFGADENDFELALARDAPRLETGAFVYIEGTEYGGIIDGFKADSKSDTIVYIGRTWHGILNSKPILRPLWALSGDANGVLSMLIAEIGLDGLYKVAGTPSGIEIAHEIKEFCGAYDAIRKAFAAHGLKLQMRWQTDRFIHISALPIVDYAAMPIDGDVGFISFEKHESKVNHLICAYDVERTTTNEDGEEEKTIQHRTLDLYMDQWGRIGETQYYTGLDDISEVWECSASTAAEVKKEGTAELLKRRETDKAEISLPESKDYIFDIGDIAGAAHIELGVKVAAPVTQKIVKISNGTMETEYKVGGENE